MSWRFPVSQYLNKLFAFVRLFIWRETECNWLVILRHIWLRDDHNWLVWGDVGGGGGVSGGGGGRHILPGPGRGHRALSGPHLGPGPLEGGGAGARPLGARVMRLVLTSWPGRGHPDTWRGQRLETAPYAFVTAEHEELEAVNLNWGLSEVDDCIGVNDAVDTIRHILDNLGTLFRWLLDLDSTENGNGSRGRELPVSRGARRRGRRSSGREGARSGLLGTR